MKSVLARNSSSQTLVPHEAAVSLLSFFYIGWMVGYTGETEHIKEGLMSENYSKKNLVN